MMVDIIEKEERPLVLIVDDIPRNIKVLGDILRTVHCRIAVATNGPQALETVKKVLPDIILLDVMMPEMADKLMNKKSKMARILSSTRQ